MTRQSAIVSLSPLLCGTLMRAAPHSASAVHHHGGQDTVVYAVSGRGAIVFSPRQTKPSTERSNANSQAEAEGEAGPIEEQRPCLQRKDLSPGDWALIPAGVEHQEINEGEEEVVWVIVRSPGGVPEVVNLEGWSQPPVA